MKAARNTFFFAVMLALTVPAMAQDDCETPFQNTSFQQANADLIAQERAVLDRMQSDPAGFYFELRKKAQKELARGSQDFTFSPLRPVIERIARDLRHRQTLKFGEKYLARLQELETKARALVANGDPFYKKSIRFIMNEYNPMLDAIFGERHPDLIPSNFHKNNAEHLLEKFLAKSPDLLMYFSFEPVDFDFFLKTRSAPFQLVGIDLRGLDDVSKPPFADGYFMKPSEFTWHDLGHIDFMAFRDVAYIEKANKPIERIIWEWDATRRRVLALYDEIKASDPELGEAMNIVLSELLHERGFQYSLTVLKQELETPKWLRAVFRKKNKSHTFYPDTKDHVFERLEEARRTLLRFINRLRDQDQMLWIQASKAEIVPSLITHTPALGWSSGHLNYIEIAKPNQPVIHTLTAAGANESIPVREILTVQLSPTQQSPFTEEVVTKMEALLASGVKAIRIGADKQLSVVLASGETAAFDQVTVPANLPLDIPQIENLTVFEMNQVFWSHEQNRELEYTLRTSSESYIGRVRGIRQSLVDGLHVVTIQNDRTDEVREYPLSDIRVDPLTRGDIDW